MTLSPGGSGYLWGSDERAHCCSRRPRAALSDIAEVADYEAAADDAAAASAVGLSMSAYLAQVRG
jgi:hypothetical protein